MSRQTEQLCSKQKSRERYISLKDENENSETVWLSCKDDNAEKRNKNQRKKRGPQN